MLKIKKDTCVYAFSKDNAPVLTIDSGEAVVFETSDCFGDQLQTNEDKLDKLDWNRVNPASGPVFIRGAKPGDVLRVTIISINCESKGVIATGEGIGVLQEKYKGLTSRVVPIVNNEVAYNEKLHFPLNKMIGVIGVAPEGEPINCGTPGCHGGNMDNTMITDGVELYLPIFVEGALFALGDLHAAMGDGEISGTGLEVAGSVEVKLDVVKNMKLKNPLLRNDKYFVTIASRPTVDEAINNVVSDMHEMLLAGTGLSSEELTMLLSLTANVQICQVVDPLKTVRFTIPNSVLTQLGFKL